MQRYLIDVTHRFITYLPSPTSLENLAKRLYCKRRLEALVEEMCTDFFQFTADLRELNVYEAEWEDEYFAADFSFTDRRYGRCFYHAGVVEIILNERIYSQKSLDEITDLLNA